MTSPALRPTAPTVTLLADHDEDTRAMYAEYLTRAQCEVVQVEDGREALAMALSRRPDALVTDTRLPGIDGTELCRLLRGDPSTASMMLVVVTGDAQPADLQRAREAGADSVLVKPCLPETLLGELQRLVALRQASAETLGRTITRLRAPQRGKDRKTVARAIQRGETTRPPLAPPVLSCPHCDRRLTYARSHVGGVSSHSDEQWDYYQCPSGCGAFQYRHRTRRLRRV